MGTRLGLALFVIGLASLAATADAVTPYVSTHWAIDYSFGFVKRGLVGGVLGLVAGPLDPATIGLSALVLAVLAVGAYCILATKVEPKSPEAIGFVLLGLLASQAVAQFGRDLGRFDQIGFVAAAVVLLFIARVTQAPALVGLGLVVAVAMLAHEAVFAIFVPMLAAVAWIEHRARAAWFLGPILVAFVAIMLLGGLRVAPEQACAHYAQQLPADCRVVAALATPLLTSAKLTLHHALTHYASTVAWMAAILAAWWTLFACIHRAAGSRYWLAAVLANAPLGLCLVGIDYFRWMHLAIVNGVLVALYLGQRQGFPTVRAKAAMLAAIAIVVFSLVPGSAVETPRPPAVETLLSP